MSQGPLRAVVRCLFGAFSVELSHEGTDDFRYIPALELGLEPVSDEATLAAVAAVVLDRWRRVNKPVMSGKLLAREPQARDLAGGINRVLEESSAQLDVYRQELERGGYNPEALEERMRSYRGELWQAMAALL